MRYHGTELTLREDRVTDRLGTITLADIPDPQPRCPVRLTGTTRILERLWRVALWDIESNIRENALGRYFAGGAAFRATVFTRDISYSGVLGLNRLYPDLMRSSLEVTRRVRRECGFSVPRDYVVSALPAPWKPMDITDHEFRERFNTNSIARRTDDVVWLWAAGDLFFRLNADVAMWDWLYATGVEFFDSFYQYFFDPADGLYRGQASFIDVAWPGRERPVGGYPSHFKIDDCLLLKAASTNALYVKGLRVLAETAARLGRADEARTWKTKEQQLQQAIRTNLIAPDGRIAYYKDRHGNLSDRTEVLGTALSILHDAVDPGTGARALRHYPRTEVGIPVITPFYDTDSAYHNNGSWPFTDTLFLAAAEKALDESQAAYNLALLARTVRADGFHEIVDMRNGEVKGSGHQLWSASAFINACLRADLRTTAAV